MDVYLALFLFVFMVSSVFVLVSYRLSFFTILYYAVIGYLYYEFMNGKITSENLMRLSFIPTIVMSIPIIVVLHVIGIPLGVLIANGISREMFEIV
jgi:ABC-type phosphate transport system permease subunit